MEYKLYVGKPNADQNADAILTAWKNTSANVPVKQSPASVAMHDPNLGIQAFLKWAHEDIPFWEPVNSGENELDVDHKFVFL